MLNQAMLQMLKTAVLKIAVQEQEIVLMLKVQETHQTALATQLEIATSL